MNISLIQYPITESLGFEAFCEKMRSLLKKPDAKHIDLHVFPELHSAELLSPKARTGELEGEEWRAIAAHFSDYAAFVSTLAQETKSIIVGGTFPRLREGELRNTCVIAKPTGEVVLQEKIFLTSVERSKWKWAGGSQIHVLEHAGFKIVTLVCYDIEFPQLTELLTEVRPHLILVPSCTSAHYGYHRVRWCAQARAIEHFAFVAATGTVGSLASSPSFRENEGQAYVLSPSEAGYPRIIAEGAMNRAEQVLAELDLAGLEKDRARVAAYPARDQRDYEVTINLISK